MNKLISLEIRILVANISMKTIFDHLNSIVYS